MKGWFQETVPGFLAEHRAALSRHPVLVHFDADLYSSTLFLLHVIGLSLRRFYFVFDEFPGDETRALYNFLQAFGGKVEFFGRTDRALQVSGYAELPALEPAPDGAPPGMEVVGL